MVLSKLFTPRTYGIITPISGNKPNSTGFSKRKPLNKYKNLIFYSNQLVKKQNSFEKINNSYVLKKCNCKCLPKSNNKTSLGGTDSIFHLKRANSFNFLKTNCNARLSHSYTVCNGRNYYTFIQSHKNLIIRPKRLSSFKNFIQEKTYGDNAFNKNHGKREENIKEKVNSNSRNEKNIEQNATKILANNVYHEATSKTYENLCDSESTDNLYQERENYKKMQEKNFVKNAINFSKNPSEINNSVPCFNSEQQNKIYQDDNFKKDVVGEDFNSIESEKVVIEDYFKKYDLHVDRNKVISYYQKSTEDKMKAYGENNEEYFENVTEIKPFVIDSDSEKLNKMGNQECINLNELPSNNDNNNNSSTIMSNEEIHELSETSPNYELMRKEEEEIKISDEINNSNLDIKAEKQDIKTSHKLNLNCDILHKGVRKSSLKENTIHKTPENIDARNFSTVVTHHEKFISKMEDIKSDPNLKKNNLLKTNYEAVNNDFLQKTMTEHRLLKEKLDAEKLSCSEYADTKNSDYRFNGNSYEENSYKLGKIIDSNSKADTNEIDNGKQSYKNLDLCRVSNLGDAITKKYSHPNDDYNDNILNESEANSASLSDDKAEVLKIQQKILAAEKNSYSNREVGEFDRSQLSSENNIPAGNDKTELYKIQQKILAAEKKITGVMENDPQISQPIVFDNKGIAEQKTKKVLQGYRDESILQDEDDSDVYVLAPINENNFNSLKDSEEEIFILTELPSNKMAANDSENTEYSIILDKNQMENLFDGKEYKTYESDKGINKIINIKDKQYKISDVSTMKTNNVLDSENSTFIKNDSVINTSNSIKKKRLKDLKTTKKAISNNLSNNSKSPEMSKQNDRTGIEQLQQNNLSNFKKFNTAVEKNKSKRNTKLKILSGNNNNSSKDKNKVDDKNSTLSTKLFPGVNNINNVSRLKKITKHSCINKDKNFVKKEINNTGTSVKKDNRSRRLYSNFCEKMDVGTGKHTVKDDIAVYNNREQKKSNVIKKDSHNYRKFNIGGKKEFKINRHPLLNNVKVHLTHLKHYKTDQTDKIISNSEEIDDKNTISKNLVKSNEIEAIKNNCKPKSNTGRDLCDESMNGLVNNIKNDISSKKNNAIIKNVSKKMNEVNSDLLTDIKYFNSVNNCKETENYKKNTASTLKSANFFRTDHTYRNNKLLVLSENEDSHDKNDKADQALFKNNDSDFIETNKLEMFGIKSSQEVFTKDEASSNQKSYKKDNENLESDPFGLRTSPGEKYREPTHSLKNNDEVKSVTNHGDNFINSGLKDVFKSKSEIMNGKVNDFEDTSSKAATELLKTREINWNDSVTIDNFTSENCEVEINKTETMKAFEDKYPCKSYIKNYMDSENKVNLQEDKNCKAINENKFSDTADVEPKNTENKFTVDAFNSYQSPINHSVHKKDDKMEQKHFKISEKSNKSKYNSQIPKAINKQFKNTVIKNINCENNGLEESEKIKNEIESVLSMKTGSFEQNEVRCNSKSEDIFSLLEEKVRASIDDINNYNDLYMDNINNTESPLYNFKINQNLRAWERFKQGYTEDIVYENKENDTNKNINADLPKQEIPASLKDEIHDNYLKNEVSHQLLSEIKENVSIQKNYNNEIKNCDEFLNDSSTGMNEQNILSDSIHTESAENENKSSILSNLCHDNGNCDNKLDNQRGSISKHTLFQNEKTVLINENEESNMKNNFDYDKILKVNDKILNDDDINYCKVTQNDTNVSKSEKYVDLFGSDGCKNASDDNDAAEITSLIKLLSESYANQQNNSSSITDELLILGKKYKEKMKNENSEQDSDEDNCNIESLLTNCMIEAASGCVEQDYSLEFIDSRTRLRLLEEIFEVEEKTLNRENTPKKLSIIETDNNLLSDSKTGIKTNNQDEENNTSKTIDQCSKKTLVTKYSSNSEITSNIDDKKYEAPLLQVKDIMNFGETIVNESCKMFKLETPTYLQTSQLCLNNSSMRNDCLPVLYLSKENKFSNIPSETVISKTDHSLKNNKNNVQIVAQRSFSTSSKSINEEEKNLSVPQERSLSLPVKLLNMDEKTDSFIRHEKSYSAPNKLINEERINTSFHHQKPFSTPFKSVNKEETNTFVHGENLTENHPANLKTEQPVKVSSMTHSGTEQRCFAILNGKKIDKRETDMFDMFDQHGNKLKMKIKLENENESTNLHNMSKQPVCNLSANKRITENKEFNNPLLVKKEIKQMAELIQNIKCLKHPTETFSAHAGNNLIKIEKKFFQSNEEALKNVCTSKKSKNDEKDVIGEDFKKNCPSMMYPLFIVQDKLCSNLSQKQTNYSSVSNSKLCCGVSYNTNRKFSCSCKDFKNSSTKEAIKKPEKNKQENILNENLTLIFPKDKKMDNPRPVLEKEAGDKKSATGRDILRIFHNQLIKKLKSTMSNTENNTENNQSDQNTKLDIKPPHVAKNSNIATRLMRLRHYSGPFIRPSKETASLAGNKIEKKEMNTLNLDTKKENKKNLVASSKFDDEAVEKNKQNKENHRKQLTGNRNTLKENDGSTANKILKQSRKNHSKLPEKVNKSFDNQMKAQSDSDIASIVINDNAARKISKECTESVTKLENKETKDAKEQIQTLAGNSNVVFSNSNKNKPLNNINHSPNNCSNENQSNILKVKSAVSSEKIDTIILDKESQKPLGDHKITLEKDNRNYNLTDKTKDQFANATSSKENINHNSINNSGKILIKNNEDVTKNTVENNENLSHKDKSDSEVERQISTRDEGSKSSSLKETKPNLSKSVKASSQIPLPTKSSPLENASQITSTKKIKTTMKSGSPIVKNILNNCDKVVFDKQRSEVKLNNENKGSAVKLNPRETGEKTQVVSRIESKCDDDVNTIFQNASQMTYSVQNNIENTDFKSKTYLIDVQKALDSTNIDTTGRQTMNTGILEPTTQTKEDEYCRAAVLYEVLDSDEFSVHDSKTNGFTKVKNLAGVKSADNSHNMINEMFTEVQEEIFLNEKIEEKKYDKCEKNESHGVIQNKVKQNEDSVNVKNEKSIIINKPDKTSSEKSDISSNHKDSTGTIIIKSAQKMLSDGDYSESNVSSEKSESSTSSRDIPEHNNLSSLTHKVSEPIIVQEENSRYGTSKEKKYSNSNGNVTVPRSLNKIGDFRESGDFEPDFNEYLKFFNRPNLNNFLSEYNFPITNDEKIDVPYPKGSHVFATKYDTAFLRKIFRQLPSVSTVLNNTLTVPSISALNKWKAKLTMKFGDRAYEKLNEDCITYDTQFHDYIQKYLTGMPLDELCAAAHPAVKNCLISLKSVFSHLSDVTFVETHTIHSQLPYHGIIDCVAQYNNTPVLIEWKQADSRTCLLRLTHDAPIQLVAYLGAFNHDKIYKFQVTSGLIVIAYTDGSPADVFLLSIDDCSKYWRVWLSRLADFLDMRKGYQNLVK